MARYTDDDIRSMKKVTAKIAADYLGISPMAVTIGMRNSSDSFFYPFGLPPIVL